MKHKLAIGMRMLVVFLVVSFARPSIYSANGPTGVTAPSATKSSATMGAATATSISALVDAVPHVPERAGLVLVGIALLGSAALLRRKWKVVRPS